jgi:mutator protein MutT
LALKVVAGFLRKEDRFLLVRRPVNKKRGGLWEFPGGKVENGETLESAIKRELEEELGIKAKVERILGKINYKYPEGEIELFLFEIDSKEEPILKEALELRWVNFEEVKELELCPADKKLLESLKKDL